MSLTIDRVRDAIGTSGMPQGDFAQAVGLDPSKMSKSLAGTRRFSSTDLARIAERAGVSVDWLLGAPETALTTAARASRGSSSTTAIAHAEHLVELRETATRLGYPQRWQPIQPSSPTGLAVDQGDRLARTALVRLGVHGLSTTRADLAATIEDGFGVDVAILDLGEGFDGLAATGVHARVILATPTPVAFRQRFTVAHELGHLLAGDDQGVHLDEDIEASRRARDVSEMRANAFAASFLMPQDELRARVGSSLDEAGFCRLALRLMVSPAALAYRLASLRIIDEMTRDRWRVISAVTAARTVGAPDLAPATGTRHPVRLGRDLLDAYLERRTTLRPYASLLGVDTATVRASLEDAEQPAVTDGSAD